MSPSWMLSVQSFMFFWIRGWNQAACFITANGRHGIARRRLCAPLHKTNRKFTSTVGTFRFIRPSSFLFSSKDSVSSDESKGGYFADAEEEDAAADWPEGIPSTFVVVKQYSLPPSEPFDLKALEPAITQQDIDRLGLTPTNVSLPVALMMLDPKEYSSFSKARKACRKGNILIQSLQPPSGSDEYELEPFQDTSICKVGRVIDRISPGDMIGKQVRMGTGGFPVPAYQKPPFDVPVIYEDDHFAIVQKPAGVVVYSQRKGGHGTMTIRAALPYCLQPPAVGTYSALRRPASVHRLDKPTSGCLVIAKTKPAMLNLCQQFSDRIVQKTYMAILNGIPFEPPEHMVTEREAREVWGVDTGDPSGDKPKHWNVIDSPLNGKSAVTLWRTVRYVPSLHAEDETLTLVELKPKTGRYHQLRRHMAWVCERPMVGDSEYDRGTPSAMSFRERGLFLCSTSITLQHPFYNNGGVSGTHFRKMTASDELELEQLLQQELFSGNDGTTKATVWSDEAVAPQRRIMVRAETELPSKFSGFLEHEQSRYHKFQGSKPG